MHLRFTMRALRALGLDRRSMAVCCSSAEFVDLNVLNIAASEHIL